jgi:hypothetical protein
MNKGKKPTERVGAIEAGLLSGPLPRFICNSFLRFKVDLSSEGRRRCCGKKRGSSQTKNAE